MQIKFLKSVVSSVAGNSASGIVDLLLDKKNVNEFIISKKLNLTINQTRNILYRLADEGLVSFVRKKDSRKGGWYTYFWSMDFGKALEFLKKKIEEQLHQQEELMGKRKNERFYYSPDVGTEYNEEQALELSFICPETGNPLQLKDNAESVLQLEKEIAKIKGLLEEVNKELEEQHAKENKVKQRRLKAEEVKKMKEKELKKKQREKEKAKLAKKAGKVKKVKSSKKSIKKPSKKIKGKKKR